jgi:hypothetical protein
MSDDSLGRLTKKVTPFVDEKVYTYDEMGNRQNQSKNGAGDQVEGEPRSSSCIIRTISLSTPVKPLMCTMTTAL